LDTFKEYPTSMTIVLDGDITYTFNGKGENKLIVAYTSPLQQIPDIYPKVSSIIDFEQKLAKSSYVI
jgi:hypothetical protein